MVVMLPLMVALYLSTKDLKQQWLYGLIATLTVVMIVYAKTRAAWLAVLFQSVAVLVFLLIKTRSSIAPFIRQRKAQLLVFALLFVGMIHFNSEGFNPNGIVSLGEQVQSIGDQANLEKQSGNIRLTNWVNTLVMIKERGALGVGLGNWQLEYPLFKSRSAQDWMAVSNVIWNYTHNDYLETMASLGWIGILFLMALAGSLLLLVKRVIATKSENSTVLTNNIAALLALLGLGITAFFSFPLQLIHSLVFAFTLVGVLLATQTKTISFKLPSMAKNVMVVVSVTMLIGTSYHSYGEYQAREAYRQSGKYLRRNDYKNMLPHALEAYRWKPWSKEILEVVGIAQSQLAMRQEATRTYMDYIKLYPNSVSALENASISFLHTGNYGESMEAVKQLLAIEPDSIVGNINMGTLLHAHKGNFKKQASGYYVKALKLSPNHPQKEMMQRIIDEQLLQAR